MHASFRGRLDIRINVLHRMLAYLNMIENIYYFFIEDKTYSVDEQCIKINKI